MLSHSCLWVLALAYAAILGSAGLGHNDQGVIEISALHPGAVLYDGNYFQGPLPLLPKVRQSLVTV